MTEHQKECLDMGKNAQNENYKLMAEEWFKDNYIKVIVAISRCKGCNCIEDSFFLEKDMKNIEFICKDCCIKNIKVLGVGE